MAEEKTYVFGESANNGILGLLGPMLSQRGVDPNVLLAMQGSNKILCRLHRLRNSNNVRRYDLIW